MLVKPLVLSWTTQTSQEVWRALFILYLADTAHVFLLSWLHGGCCLNVAHDYAKYNLIGAAPFSELIQQLSLRLDGCSYFCKCLCKLFILLPRHT